MPFAYIGTLNQGGTCLMRGELMEKLLQGRPAFFIDARQSLPVFNRVFQSLGFKYKIGPLIQKVNRHVAQQIEFHEQYDFIWVDKAIYLTPKTTRLLKSKTSCLIHFTPDTAFYTNKSRFFYKSLPIYDFVITTKSFDREYYLRYIPKEKLLLRTQGYDARFHKSYGEFKDKEVDLAFIGLWEAPREELLQYLLDKNFSIKLGGHRWSKFVMKNRNNKILTYLGASVRNEEYGMHISSARFSPGLLSKRFPELHTTRTFEIPACGTALLTEDNQEISSFFKEDEAIFYHSYEDMLDKITHYKNHQDALETLIGKGMARVKADGRDYESILKDIMERIGILKKAH